MMIERNDINRLWENGNLRDVERRHREQCLKSGECLSPVVVHDLTVNSSLERNCKNSIKDARTSQAGELIFDTLRHRSKTEKKLWRFS